MAASNPRLDPVTSDFFPSRRKLSRTMLALPKLYRLEFGREDMNARERDKVCRSGNKKGNHIAASPLQGVAHYLSDQHSPDCSCHAAHTDHRAYCLRRKSIGR